jgi:hypothetical protein
MHTITLTIRAMAMYFTAVWCVTGQYLAQCTAMHRVYAMPISADKFTMMLT